MSETTTADQSEGTPERPPSLWRDRDFVRLWVGHTASQFASQVSTLTVPLVAVMALSSSPDEVGLLRAVGQLPYLLFALFVGVLVDRWRRRNVMVVADFARALALGAIPLFWALDALGTPVLYAVMLVVGTFTVLFDVAYQAYLPRLIDRESLARGNSLMESSRSGAQIGGPAFGGVLVSLLTAPVAIVASCVTYLVSAISIQRIRRPEPEPDPTAAKGGVLRQIREGVGLVARDPMLRTVAATACVFNFFFSAFMTAYLLFLPRDLELSGAAVGLCLAAFGPGFLVGALVAGTAPGRLGYGPVLVLSAAVSDGVMLLVGAMHGSGALTVAGLVVINFLYAAFAQTFNVALMAVRQAITPDEIQGRVVATIRFLGVGLAPLGSALGGVLGGAAGLRASLLVAAGGMCLAPLVLLISPLARLGRELPEHVEQPGKRA
ncbi:Predicted arabinose efflux permease, MFS family [Streptomyces zhaozhouensis]|uniref:Predicted arabinose efflux permease, MFS family n=1 Tax=Streptomyces zhaozhouensis TaxID=1300267 RepID=A0A286DLC0_9ACTN|nr:MFS transporter [Streptomyces zhaozhouensis]SOD59512.1 Predicted arabinose efflux permease, MFS family [Streptomyces zhaozhouensis]